MEINFDRNLFKKGETVAVALSGGRDSACLFHLMLENAEELGITVKAINVDHGIRGENSEKDSRFVAELCKKRGVPLFFRKYDCLKYAAESGSGVEEAARKKRYECFENAVEGGFCDKIATAHHLSDNAETVLLNLFRGAAGGGAKGISDKRGYIVRPLLKATREEIDAYALENGIEFVEDETNAATDYSRNFIRNRLVPVIKEKFPSFERAIGRFSEISEEENAYLDGEAEKAIAFRYGGYSVSEKESPCIFSRASVIAMKKCGVKKDYEKVHADAVRELKNSENGSEISLPKGVKAVREYGYITFYREREKTDREEPFKEGEIRFGDNIIRIDEKASEEGKTLRFDADKIPENSVIRTRRDGDVFRKFGGGTKKLNDYFTDIKLPKRLRDSVPLICSGNNVLVVSGTEISDDVKITENTKRALFCQIKYENTEDNGQLCAKR